MFAIVNTIIRNNVSEKIIFEYVFSFKRLLERYDIREVSLCWYLNDKSIKLINEQKLYEIVMLNEYLKTIIDKLNN